MVLPAVLAAGLLVLVAAPRVAEALPEGDLWISEVMYNPGGFGDGDDDGSEWVELFNAGPTDIDLSDYSLGWGGADHTAALLPLSGMISSGQYFVVGGPAGDQAADFDPDLGNGFWISAGIALFDMTAPATPVHVVIYGGLFGNLGGLIDETGAVGDVDAPFPFLPGGSSVEFDGAGWTDQGTPTAGGGTLVSAPESTPALLMLLGLAGLAAKGTPRNRRPR